MKVDYTSSDGRLNCSVEGDQKDVFKQLSEFQEIFENLKCGACDSDNVRFVVRTVDENDYYELKCQACYSKLEFGQTKKGDKLFPKRKDRDTNEYKPNGGWAKWNPQDIPQ